MPALAILAYARSQVAAECGGCRADGDGGAGALRSADRADNGAAARAEASTDCTTPTSTSPRASPHNTWATDSMGQCGPPLLATSAASPLGLAVEMAGLAAAQASSILTIVSADDDVTKMADYQNPLSTGCGGGDRWGGHPMPSTLCAYDGCEGNLEGSRIVVTEQLCTL